MEQEIKRAANRLIASLLETGTTDPIERLNIQAKISLAQIALSSSLAVLGTCAVSGCGSDLQFEGRASGLYVCCLNVPKHCWKLG